MKLSIKPLLISYLIIVIAVTAGMLAFGDTYSFYITREDTATDEVTFETDPEGIVMLYEIKGTEEYFRVTVKALEPGKAEGTVIYTLDRDNPQKMQKITVSSQFSCEQEIVL